MPRLLPELPEGADLAALGAFVHGLEAQHGWLDADLPRNCFLMGEEVGELFRAVRRLEAAERRGDGRPEALVAQVGEEVVDVLNYLLAICDRLGIDLEQAFRAKNALNQTRTWG